MRGGPSAHSVCSASADVQWELRCLRRTAVRVKLFPQVSHEYGRSPVCERTWRCRSPDPAKHFPQVWQLYGLSPVCLALCLMSLRCMLKDFPH